MHGATISIWRPTHGGFQFASIGFLEVYDTLEIDGAFTDAICLRFPFSLKDKVRP